ncbi:6-phosphogluconate dehydrogenase [Chryseobacterium soldanellicola]|uniref:6-phosphogluconate dehydrogenase, decarboxylating n=1 Tax=Chryseobacterium soldanellicola TaxID=311333 RepID=A0A1H1CK29_9FLAO|nr:NADP-dependent phosphogluconate dehydrogenase [Chryseobacterium soldanellicola]SDQ64429.1 6-phosphogluconate dehydrogenase [Chryseobacterium soldanellicola]
MKQENQNQNSFGMIGLGTMGSNLLQNIADHGYSCAGYDNSAEKVNALNALDSENIQGFSNLKEFTDSLKSPKIVMMLVPAGEIVDNVIDELLAVLDKGDIIIDGGNSHYTDTERRYLELEGKGLHFVGMGVSGGEEGARRGPSMMPGGDKEAYEAIKPVLEKIAAQVNGEPTVAFMGNRSAGHFVKMVHNGIEYAIMQLISESYEIMKRGLQMENDQIHEVYKKWNQGRLKSYLLEITTDIFAFKNEGEEGLLLDNIRDEAKAKGTGKWTSQGAMDLHLPTPVIDISVSMRDLSSLKNLRVQASKIYPDLTEMHYGKNVNDYCDQLEEAFYFAMVSAYAQGMHLLYQANIEFKYDLKLDLIAKIWRGGCIIRSEFLEDIYAAFNKDPELQHLLLDKTVAGNLIQSIPSARTIVSDAAIHGISTPAFSAALTYFDNFRSESMPTNLIQAQRDYFGSHTYELKAKEGVFHTKWIMENIKQ